MVGHGRKTAVVQFIKSGNWQVVVEVPPGKYQYCLVIDGQWQADRYNDKQHVNDYGEPNSVIEVMTREET